MSVNNADGAGSNDTGGGSSSGAGSSSGSTPPASGATASTEHDGRPPDFDAIYRYAGTFIELGDMIYEYAHHTIDEGFHGVVWSGDSNSAANTAASTLQPLMTLLAGSDQHATVPSAARLLWNIGESINWFAINLEEQRAKEKKDFIIEVITTLLGLFFLGIFGALSFIPATAEVMAQLMSALGDLIAGVLDTVFEGVEWLGTLGRGLGDAITGAGLGIGPQLASQAIGDLAAHQNIHFSAKDIIIGVLTGAAGGVIFGPSIREAAAAAAAAKAGARAAGESAGDFRGLPDPPPGFAPGEVAPRGSGGDLPGLTGRGPDGLPTAGGSNVGVRGALHVDHEGEGVNHATDHAGTTASVSEGGLTSDGGSSRVSLPGRSDPGGFPPPARPVEGGTQPDNVLASQEHPDSVRTGPDSGGGFGSDTRTTAGGDVRSAVGDGRGPGGADVQSAIRTGPASGDGDVRTATSNGRGSGGDARSVAGAGPASGERLVAIGGQDERPGGAAVRPGGGDPTSSPIGRVVAEQRVNHLRQQLDTARAERPPSASRSESEAGPKGGGGHEGDTQTGGRGQGGADGDLASRFPAAPTAKPVTHGATDLEAGLARARADAESAGMPPRDIKDMTQNVRTAIDDGRLNDGALHLAKLRAAADRLQVDRRLQHFREHIDDGYQRPAEVGIDKVTWLEKAVAVEKAAAGGRVGDVDHLLKDYDATVGHHLQALRTQDAAAAGGKRAPGEEPPAESRSGGSSDVGDQGPGSTPGADDNGIRELADRLAALRADRIDQGGLTGRPHDQLSAKAAAVDKALGAAHKPADTVLGKLRNPEDADMAKVAAYQKAADHELSAAALRRGDSPLPPAELKSWQDSLAQFKGWKYHEQKLIELYDRRVSNYTAETQFQVGDAAFAPDRSRPLNNRIDDQLAQISKDVRLQNASRNLGPEAQPKPEPPVEPPAAKPDLDLAGLRDRRIDHFENGGKGTVEVTPEPTPSSGGRVEDVDLAGLRDRRLDHFANAGKGTTDVPVEPEPQPSAGRGDDTDLAGTSLRADHYAKLSQPVVDVRAEMALADKGAGRGEGTDLAGLRQRRLDHFGNAGKETVQVEPGTTGNARPDPTPPVRDTSTPPAEVPLSRQVFRVDSSGKVSLADLGKKPTFPGKGHTLGGDEVDGPPPPATRPDDGHAYFTIDPKSGEATPVHVQNDEIVKDVRPADASTSHDDRGGTSSKVTVFKGDTWNVEAVPHLGPGETLPAAPEAPKAGDFQILRRSKDDGTVELLTYKHEPIRPGAGEPDTIDPGYEFHLIDSADAVWSDTRAFGTPSRIEHVVSGKGGAAHGVLVRGDDGHWRPVRPQEAGVKNEQPQVSFFRPDPDDGGTLRPVNVKDTASELTFVDVRTDGGVRVAKFGVHSDDLPNLRIDHDNELVNVVPAKVSPDELVVDPKTGDLTLRTAAPEGDRPGGSSGGPSGDQRGPGSGRRLGGGLGQRDASDGSHTVTAPKRTLVLKAHADDHAPALEKSPIPKPDTEPRPEALGRRAGAAVTGARPDAAVTGARPGVTGTPPGPSGGGSRTVPSRHVVTDMPPTVDGAKSPVVDGGIAPAVDGARATAVDGAKASAVDGGDESAVDDAGASSVDATKAAAADGDRPPAANGAPGRYEAPASLSLEDGHVLRLVEPRPGGESRYELRDFDDRPVHLAADGLGLRAPQTPETPLYLQLVQGHPDGTPLYQVVGADGRPVPLLEPDGDRVLYRPPALQLRGYDAAQPEPNPVQAETKGSAVHHPGGPPTGHEAAPAAPSTGHEAPPAAPLTGHEVPAAVPPPGRDVRLIANLTLRVTEYQPADGHGVLQALLKERFFEVVKLKGATGDAPGATYGIDWLLRDHNGEGPGWKPTPTWRAVKVAARTAGYGGVTLFPPGRYDSGIFLHNGRDDVVRVFEVDRDGQHRVTELDEFMRTHRAPAAVAAIDQCGEVHA